MILLMKPSIAINVSFSDNGIVYNPIYTFFRQYPAVSRDSLLIKQNGKFIYLFRFSSFETVNQNICININSEININDKKFHFFKFILDNKILMDDVYFIRILYLSIKMSGIDIQKLFSYI